MIVILSEDAGQDLQAIFDYIEADSPRSALLVDSRICDQTDGLAEFPDMGRPGRLNGTRKLPIDRTPYIAVYSVDELLSPSCVWFTAPNCGRRTFSGRMS